MKGEIVRNGICQGGHQEKSLLLMSARFFLVIPPTKFGHLWLFYFWEVHCGFGKCTSVCFPPLFITFHCFRHFESD